MLGHPAPSDSSFAYDMTCAGTCNKCYTNYSSGKKCNATGPPECDSLLMGRGADLRSLWGDTKLQHEPRCVPASEKDVSQRIVSV